MKTSLVFISTTVLSKHYDNLRLSQMTEYAGTTTLTQFKTGLIPPEEERPWPLDIPLAVALDTGLEDEGVGVEVVVRGDGAVLAAAAGVLHHHRHRQGDTAQVL